MEIRRKINGWRLGHFGSSSRPVETEDSQKQEVVHQQPRRDVGGGWESRASSLHLIKLCSLLEGTRTERADVQEEISHYRHSGGRLSASASSMTLKNAAWKRVELFMACKWLRASSWAHTPRLASLLGSEISAGRQAECCCCCCTLSVSAQMDAGCQDLQLCRKLMRVW